MKSNTEYVIGALYDIDGLHKGVLVKLDEKGDPRFKMIGLNLYLKDDEGLVGFANSTPDEFQLIDDES